MSPTTLAGKRRATLNQTYHGTTLTSNDVQENKYGRVVSKAASKVAKKRYHSKDTPNVKNWTNACKLAQADLGEWPVPIRKSSKFYKVARKYFDEM
tara:strand:+ start:564 stop:851 length:288 start_codon:yes stop_codon:yes gene_type:complete